jgi:hypothetical protein
MPPKKKKVVAKDESTKGSRSNSESSTVTDAVMQVDPNLLDSKTKSSTRRSSRKRSMSCDDDEVHQPSSAGASNTAAAEVATVDGPVSEINDAEFETEPVQHVRPKRTMYDSMALDTETEVAEPKSAVVSGVSEVEAPQVDIVESVVTMEPNTTNVSSSGQKKSKSNNNLTEDAILKRMKEKALLAMKEAGFKPTMEKKNDKDKNSSNRNNQRRARDHRRDRSRSRSRDHDYRRRDRSNSRDRDYRRRDRSDSRDREYRRRKYRSRSRSRDRDYRRRDRSNSRDRDYRRRDRSDSRDREYRRYYDRNYRNESDSYGRDRDRRRSRSRSPPSPRGPNSASNIAEANAALVASYTGGPVNLKLVTAANPTMSIQEAIQKMSIINEAVGKGLQPPPLIGTITEISTQRHSQLQYPTAVTRTRDHVQYPNTHVNARIHKQAYIGNIPLGTTTDYLADALSLGLKELGYASNLEQSCCTRVILNAGNSYGFAQFLTNEDANASIWHLNGMTIGDNALRIARPKNWVPPIEFHGQTHYTTENCLLTVKGTGAPVPLPQQGLSGEPPMLPPPPPPAQHTTAQPVHAAISNNIQINSGSNLQAQENIQLLAALKPTRILKLYNMVTADDLKDDKSYEELIEDVGDECAEHGNVDEIIIPRSGANVGSVLVQFTDETSATAALQSWSRKIMGNNRIRGYFYPEDLFEKGIYMIPS